MLKYTDASLRRLERQDARRLRRRQGVALLHLVSPSCVSILYLGKHADGWYDEGRYDSHDRTRGRLQEAPHFRMKLRSAFKADTDLAAAEIRGIIVADLGRIEAVLRK
jgi:hypothetical protein